MKPGLTATSRYYGPFFWPPGFPDLFSLFKTIPNQNLFSVIAQMSFGTIWWKMIVIVGVFFLFGENVTVAL